MKIAIDGRSLLEKQWGGVSVYTSNMIHSISTSAPQGSDVRVLLSGKNISLPEGYSAPDRIKMKHVAIPNKILNLSSIVLNAPQIDKLLFLKQDPDITWLPNWNYTKTKSPYVLTVHDLSIVHHSEWFTKKQQLWHKAIHIPNLCKNAQHIIAVSHFTKQDIVQTFGIKESKITVVPEGVSPEYTPSKNESIRKKYNLPEKFILAFGGGGKRKNIELVDAIRKFLTSDIPIIVTGTRSLPYLPENDKQAILSLAWCFLYPSLFEGFGLPVLEAMASGTPVIASNVTSIPELVSDSGLLVSPYQPKQWADALDQLYSDPELYESLIQKGAIRAKEFSWDKAAEKWWRVIDNVLSLR